MHRPSASAAAAHALEIDAAVCAWDSNERAQPRCRLHDYLRGLDAITRAAPASMVPLSSPLAEVVVQAMISRSDDARRETIETFDFVCDLGAVRGPRSRGLSV